MEFSQDRTKNNCDFFFFFQILHLRPFTFSLIPFLSANQMWILARNALALYIFSSCFLFPPSLLRAFSLYKFSSHFYVCSISICVSYSYPPLSLWTQVLNCLTLNLKIMCLKLNQTQLLQMSLLIWWKRCFSFFDYHMIELDYMFLRSLIIMSFPAFWGLG